MKNCHPVAFCPRKNRSLTQECVPDVGTNEFYRYFCLPYFKRFHKPRFLRKKLTSPFLRIQVRIEKKKSDLLRLFFNLNNWLNFHLDDYHSEKGSVNWYTTFVQDNFKLT